MSELLANGIGAIVALVVTCIIVGILLRSDGLVPWQLWAAIFAVLTFDLTLVVVTRWLDRRRK